MYSIVASTKDFVDSIRNHNISTVYINPGIYSFGATMIINRPISFLVNPHKIFNSSDKAFIKGHLKIISTSPKGLVKFTSINFESSLLEIDGINDVEILDCNITDNQILLKKGVLKIERSNLYSTTNTPVLLSTPNRDNANVYIIGGTISNKNRAKSIEAQTSLDGKFYLKIEKSRVHGTLSITGHNTSKGYSAKVLIDDSFLDVSDSNAIQSIKSEIYLNTVSLSHRDKGQSAIHSSNSRLSLYHSKIDSLFAVEVEGSDNEVVITGNYFNRCSSLLVNHSSDTVKLSSNTGTGPQTCYGIHEKSKSKLISTESKDLTFELDAFLERRSLVRSREPLNEVIPVLPGYSEIEVDISLELISGGIFNLDTIKHNLNENKLFSVKDVILSGRVDSGGALTFNGGMIYLRQSPSRRVKLGKLRILFEWIDSFSSILMEREFVNEDIELETLPHKEFLNDKIPSWMGPPAHVVELYKEVVFTVEVFSAKGGLFYQKTGTM